MENLGKSRLVYRKIIDGLVARIALHVGIESCLRKHAEHSFLKANGERFSLVVTLVAACAGIVLNPSCKSRGVNQWNPLRKFL